MERSAWSLSPPNLALNLAVGLFVGLLWRHAAFYVFSLQLVELCRPNFGFVAFAHSVSFSVEWEWVVASYRFVDML